MRNGLSPRRAGLLGAVALLAAGCGGAGDVTGTVTYQGKPVVTGSVTFYGPDKTPYLGAIDEKGNYKVVGVPSGARQVTVASPDPLPPPGAKSGKPSNPNLPEGTPEPKGTRPEGWRAIPTNYADPNASKLTFEVRGGANTIDIPLE
ncbi:MAG TPA: hypothetical protein VD866_29650 [Urbifossiella sp.]|nr:hypothetical protein [Urbifossiella sp.]